MATSLPPPRPPVPPQPPGNRGHLVIIALLVLALIVLVGGIGVWVGLRLISRTIQVEVGHGDNANREVSIKTPLGSLEVHKDVNEASLGLPIYPGATQIKNDDTATVDLDIADQTKVHVLAGKFETADSYDKVVAFYHDRLGSDVTNFKQRDEEGKTVFEIKQDKQQKVVALKSDGDKTVIELVRVAEGKGEAN